MTGRLKPRLHKRSLPPQTKKLGDGIAVSSVASDREQSQLLLPVNQLR